MNKAAIGTIRAFFATASRIAPKVTGRMAFKLFCTTFPISKKSAQHQAILARAKQQFSQAKHHSIAYSNGTIAAFEFSPTATSDSGNELQTVLLVHGWQSHSAFMSQFIEPLLQRGFRVIAIDLPGHGESSGRLFHLPLGVEAIHATRNKFGHFDKVISHSLGGAVVATTLAGTLPNYPSVPVSSLVLISSPNSMNKIFNDFSAMIGLNTAANAALHENVTRLSGLVTDEFSVAPQLQKLDTDILLMHAPDDKEIAFSEAEIIAQTNALATLQPMPGLGHRRIIADDKVVAAAVDFLVGQN